MVKTESDWLSVKDKFKEFYDNNTVKSDDCILWTKTKPYQMGKNKPKMYLTVLINGKNLDVRKAVNWLMKGFSLEKYTYVSCGVDNCVNTSHVFLTNNQNMHKRKDKCEQGHDLTDESNVLFTKRYLATGEPYYKIRCRICQNLKRHGKEPSKILDNRKVTVENFNIGYDKDKCKFGHDLISKTYTSGVTKRICPKCKAESTSKKRKEQRNATTNYEK